MLSMPPNSPPTKPTHGGTAASQPFSETLKEKFNIMKKVIVIFLLAFSFQNLFSQTTQEEYNYITKGYKIQLESGLDMKKGYSLTELESWGLTHNSEKRNCTFKGLFREGQSKPCAIMLIYKRTDLANGAVFYICIPSHDAPENIWEQTLGFINDNFKENIQLNNTVIWALMKFASQETQK